MTAPVVVDLSVEDARECVDQIREAVAVAWEWVVTAYKGRAWIALGYPNWDALCDGEFAGARIRLPREERREAVAALREAGLSTRAIASATGTSEATVRRDTPGASYDAPAAPVTGIDGKTYAPTQPAHPAPEPAAAPDVVDAEMIDDPLPPEIGAEIQRRLESRQQRMQAEAEGARFAAEINARTTPETKAWADEQHRRIRAVLHIAECCEELMQLAGDPAEVIEHAPDHLMARLDIVPAAADYLTRFREELETRV